MKVYMNLSTNAKICVKNITRADIVWYQNCTLETLFEWHIRICSDNYFEL